MCAANSPRRSARATEAPETRPAAAPEVRTTAPSEAASPERKVLDLDAYVPALITFVSNKLSAGASNTYRKLFNVGVTEWRILSQLAIEPRISANRVCQVIGFDKALVSRSVQGLAERGLVAIVPDGADARRKTLALTAAGEELHGRIIEVALERERRLLDGFSTEERRVLIALLHRMHAQIGAVNGDGPGGRPTPRRRRTRGAAR